DAKQSVPVRVETADVAKKNLVEGARDYVFKLALVSSIEVVPSLGEDKLSARAVAGGLSIEVPLAGLIDVGAESARLTKELEKAQKEIDGLNRQLSNASFVDRAPKEVVAEKRQRLADYQDQATKLADSLKRLK